jgi:hypothetical protein
MYLLLIYDTDTHSESRLSGGIMSKIKDYIQLHLNILLFSLTSVFSKAAEQSYALPVYVSDGCQLRNLRNHLATGD